MTDDMKLTATRLRALRLVADGQVEYATSYGNWEPKTEHRLPAFDWLEEHGLIAINFDAEPTNRVMKLVPVVVTEAGVAALGAQHEPTPSDETQERDA